MGSPTSRQFARESRAVVHRVDPVNRELTALVDGSAVSVYVPPDCDIFLRGERVKLRLVQPRDRVRLVYAPDAGAIVARRIEVQSGAPAPGQSE
jgi:hypothetical protein